MVESQCSLVPEYTSTVPSFPKSYFKISLVPYKVNGHVPLFPKTPGRPLFLGMLSLQLMLSELIVKVKNELFGMYVKVNACKSKE